MRSAIDPNIRAKDPLSASRSGDIANVNNANVHDNLAAQALLLHQHKKQ
jgi:hypothetical protein